MRKYDDITLKVGKMVLEKSDEIIRQRQIKATKIRHISFAVSGFCAGIILCFGIFNLTRYIKETDPSLQNNNQTSTSNISINTTSTTTSTTTVTETTNDISTVLTETSTETDKMDIEPTSEIEETTDGNQPPVTSSDYIEETEIITETTLETIVTENVSSLKPTLCGDVNGDNIIDIEDPGLITNYINYFNGTSWAEYYKKQGLDPAYAEQALANADAYRASDKRKLTVEDAKAILGYINGVYPNLPIDELKDD